jgi:hypothetical protein
LASRDADMQAVEHAAFGPSARYLSEAEGAVRNPTPCEAFAGLADFDGAKVLVTAHKKPGPVAFADAATLSAYVLRNSKGGYIRVATNRDFGISPAPWGQAGDISAEHVGGDDVVTVSGAQTNRGSSLTLSSFYAVRAGGIVGLGTVPMAWDNAGATDDDKRQLYIVGMIDKEQPRQDELRVTYGRRAWETSEDTHVVWRSEHGRYRLVSGTLPKEIVTEFGTIPALAQGVTNAAH